ncbi:hypothetical protein BD779DRAFT_585785 [Infundibulicybe gibba]|nr:hypothetical protein BD779DRAFT_585785 [Infundibulicybe gibba]
MDTLPNFLEGAWRNLEYPYPLLLSAELAAADCCGSIIIDHEESPIDWRDPCSIWETFLGGYATTWAYPSQSRGFQIMISYQSTRPPFRYSSPSSPPRHRVVTAPRFGMTFGAVSVCSCLICMLKTIIISPANRGWPDCTFLSEDWPIVPTSQVCAPSSTPENQKTVMESNCPNNPLLYLI